MYVEVWVNHTAAMNTIVDSKATHRFMTETDAKCLNILWHRNIRKMKFINWVILSVLGVVKRSPIKLGTWTGQTDFLIVEMDDFNIVLGMDFRLEYKVILMPLIKCLVVTESNPKIIQKNTHQTRGVNMTSTLQLRRDINDELTLAAIAVVEEGSSSEVTPTETSWSLHKQRNVRPESQTKYLSSFGLIDHEIDFISG